MSRRIYCPSCWRNSEEKAPLTKEDRQRGYRDRVRFLAGVKAPDVVPDAINWQENAGNAFPGIKVMRLRTVVLQCDLCGNDIPDGSFAVAITVWNTRDELEDRLIPDWEPGFGTVISEQTYRVGCVLESNPQS